MYNVSIGTYKHEKVIRDKEVLIKMLPDARQYSHLYLLSYSSEYHNIRSEVFRELSNYMLPNGIVEMEIFNVTNKMKIFNVINECSTLDDDFEIGAVSGFSVLDYKNNSIEVLNRLYKTVPEASVYTDTKIRRESMQFLQSPVIANRNNLELSTLLETYSAKKVTRRFKIFRQDLVVFKDEKQDYKLIDTFGNIAIIECRISNFYKKESLYEHLQNILQKNNILMEVLNDA